MFKTIFLLSVLLLISLCLCVVALLSNEWFIIGVKDKSCYNSQVSSINCLISKYEPALRFGLWYNCFYEIQNSAWLIGKDLDKFCFHLIPKPTEMEKIKAPKILSFKLISNYLIDMESKFMGQIQLTTLIGLMCLFVSTMISISILIFLTIKIDSKTILKKILNRLVLVMTFIICQGMIRFWPIQMLNINF